ncbi:MAG: hypothetical protein R2911_43570 [Caldilineaceae bacterium]
MAELKTQRNDAGAGRISPAIEHDQKRADAFAILDLMQEITGAEPQMWGSSIVGFGSYRYKYASR